MSTLLGKVALVTGGSRGIGAACALALAEAGADVAVTYLRSPERAEAVAERIRAAGRRAVAVRADSRDADDAASLPDTVVAELGRLDVVVNNAGVFPSGPLEEVTRREIDEALAIHARAPFLTTQAAAAHLPEGGSVVTIGTSFVGRVPYPEVTLYAMSKSALVGMTKGLARDLGPRGITVNVVHPGSTATEMNPPDTPEADAERELTATGRYGTAEGIAAMVVHLAGPGGRDITGAELSVDGGFGA